MIEFKHYAYGQQFEKQISILTDLSDTACIWIKQTQKSAGK